jgi:hypothetical protein
MEIRASDILADSGQTTEEREAETDDDRSNSDDESEASGEDEKLEDEGAKAPETDDLEDDEDKPTRLIAPEEIAAAMPPELKKRAEQWAAGVEKIEKRNEEATRKLVSNIDTWNRLVPIENALANRETAPAMLRQIVDHVARAHGLDVHELLGSKPSEEFEFEYEADKKLVELAEKRMMARLGVDPSQIKGLLAEKQHRESREAFERHLDEVAPLAIRRLKKFDGMDVTREMVSEAIRNLPQLRNEPAKAVRMWFTDQRAEARAAQATRKAPRGPEALRTVGRQPRDLPKDPMEVKASDILALHS